MKTIKQIVFALWFLSIFSSCEMDKFNEATEIIGTLDNSHVSLRKEKKFLTVDDFTLTTKGNDIISTWDPNLFDKNYGFDVWYTTKSKGKISDPQVPTSFV